MDAKSNEIAAVRDLLKAFTDLAGAVTTIDALHTQAEQSVTSVKGTSGVVAGVVETPWTGSAIRDAVISANVNKRRAQIDVVSVAESA